MKEIKAKEKTMHEVYGDGSKHLICEKCGFCITCADCYNYGCGNKKKEKKY